MSQSETSEFGSHRNRLAICVSVLLLAFAVFGWGLRSKLSLYHVASASEATPVAKLLSERERPADAAQHCYVDHADLDATSTSSIVLIVFPEQENHAKAPRVDAPPLSSRVITYKGPSLRRPPPVLAA